MKVVKEGVKIIINYDLCYNQKNCSKHIYKAVKININIDIKMNWVNVNLSCLNVDSLADVGNQSLSIRMSLILSGSGVVVGVSFEEFWMTLVHL